MHKTEDNHDGVCNDDNIRIIKNNIRKSIIRMSQMKHWYYY